MPHVKKKIIIIIKNVKILVMYYKLLLQFVQKSEKYLSVGAVGEKKTDVL